MTGSIRQSYDQRLSIAPGIEDALRSRSFAQVDAAGYRMADDLAVAQRRFFREWDHLEPDRYLRDGASYRRRRFSCFYFNPASDDLLPLSSVPYFQGTDINSYAGGISRRFASLTPSALENEFLHELIWLFFRQLPVESERRSHPWLVDVHQIRITATADQHGEAAPEGPHHDGEEFGIIQLVNRRNVTGGVNVIYSNEQEPMSSFTLQDTMDTLFLWDPDVMHWVSPVYPVDPAEPGIRDTLLIGFDPRPQLERPTSFRSTKQITQRRGLDRIG